MPRAASSAWRPVSRRPSPVRCGSVHSAIASPSGPGARSLSRASALASLIVADRAQAVEVDRRRAHDPAALLRARPRDHHALRAQAHEPRRGSRVRQACRVGEAFEQPRRAEAHAAGRSVDVDARRARALVRPRDDRAVVVGDQRRDVRRRTDARQALRRLRASRRRQVVRVQPAVLAPRDDRVGAEVEADRQRAHRAALRRHDARRRQRACEVALDVESRTPARPLPPPVGEAAATSPR